MLQLLFGLPFWQCPAPSAVSLTVVNAAPVTGELASAVAHDHSPTAAMQTSTATPRIDRGHAASRRERLKPDRARKPNIENCPSGADPLAPILNARWCLDHRGCGKATAE